MDGGLVMYTASADIYVLLNYYIGEECNQLKPYTTPYHTIHHSPYHTIHWEMVK